MSGSERDRRGLRWAFIGLGMTLVLAPAVIADHVLNAWRWAASLWPGDERGQLAAVVALRLWVWATGLLCLATAWGLKRGRDWARWSGVVCSLLLVAGFPWLTAVGGILLYFLSVRPPGARTADGADDYWSTERRESLVQVFVIGFIMLWVLIGLTWLGVFLGLPRTRMGWDFWLTVFLGELAVVTVHESGHSLAAWAVGYRFLAIRIGPLTVWKAHGNRRRVEFEWRRILLGGGFAGAVPTSEENVRRNEILVAFAGPFASCIGGMLLLLVVAQLPGSAWESHWQRIGLVSLLFLGVGFLGSLVPAGRSDGLVLWHLIFWTERGKEFIAQLRAAGAGPLKEV